jgi:hypothetical protein
MPSRMMQAGDTGYIRMTVVEAGADYFQVLVDDGVAMSITSWVPARECARLEDIGELRPIRRANPRHVER